MIAFRGWRGIVGAMDRDIQEQYNSCVEHGRHILRVGDAQAAHGLLKSWDTMVVSLLLRWLPASGLNAKWSSLPGPAQRFNGRTDKTPEYRAAIDEAVRQKLAFLAEAASADNDQKRTPQPTPDIAQTKVALEEVLAHWDPSAIHVPPEIQDSLPRFKVDHPDSSRCAFIMMRFGSTSAHEAIVKGIRAVLGKYGIEALRADDKQYHADLFPNVLTYAYGCGFGIAVFERLESDDFNPNVSLEVGYMLALRKVVCLLKDQTQKTLHTDLVGKLYRQFDPQNAETSIQPPLEQWAKDMEIIREPLR